MKLGVMYTYQGIHFKLKSNYYIHCYVVLGYCVMCSCEIQLFHLLFFAWYVPWHIAGAIPVTVSLCLLYMWHNYSITRAAPGFKKLKIFSFHNKINIM